MANVEVYKRQTQQVMKQARELCGKAEVAAMNRAAKGSITDTAGFIRKGYNIKLKDLVNKDTVQIYKANNKGNKVKIKFREFGIELMKFRASWSRKNPGATALEKKGSKKMYPGTFITMMKSGHANVLKRRGKDRLPLDQFFGPNAMQLFTNDKAWETMEDSYYKRLHKVLGEVVGFMFSKQ